MCSSSVSFLAAKPISFLEQSKQTQQLRKKGQPMTVQLFGVCLILKTSFPFSLLTTKSFSRKWIILVSRSISREVFMRVCTSYLLELRHQMQASALILHLRVEGKNFSNMRVMIWLGKAMQEELRVKMMQLYDYMLLISSSLSKTTPCILGNLPYFSSSSIFTFTIEERPFSANLCDIAPTVTTLLSLPRYTDTIFSLFLVSSNTSLRKDFSEVSSNLRETAPSQRVLRLGVTACAEMKLVELRVILSCSPMMYNPRRTTSNILLRWS